MDSILSDWQMNNGQQVVARCDARFKCGQRVRRGLNRFPFSQSTVLLTADSRLMHKHHNTGACENQSICFVTTSVIRTYVTFPFSPRRWRFALSFSPAFFSPTPVSAYRIVSLAHKARLRTPCMTNATIWRRSLCMTFTIGVLKPAGAVTYIARKNSVCLQRSLHAFLVRFSPRAFLLVLRLMR